VNPSSELIDATNLPQGDINMTPIASAADGTQIWKITHNGVDTHPIHWHLWNVQVLNRVTWDNIIIPPDPAELGWKETVRISPLEDTIVALRPIIPTVPFELPNSVRDLNPMMPEGVDLSASTNAVDQNGNPTTQIFNNPTNFGWEYVYHCHILAHEEMDMMHSMVFAVAPWAPSNLSAYKVNDSVILAWSDNSIAETGFTIQRANDTAFTTGLVNFTVGKNAVTYNDTGVDPNQTYYYRVQANNLVGDTATYAGSTIGFPTTYANSTWTNTAASNAGVYNIGLHVGWNLISIPLSGSGLQASGLVSNPNLGIVMVSKYDTATGIFNSYYTGAPAGSDFALDPDIGYFVYSSVPSMIAVTGTPLPPHSITIDPAGWNMIGWSSLNSVTASTLFGRANLVMISRYDPVTGAFQNYYTGAPQGSDFTIRSGEGYFVYPGTATAQQLNIG
jgi:hypothetical protein